MRTITGTERIELRLTPAAKRVLQSAATAVRRSVSEFVLESALARRGDAAGSATLRHFRPHSMHLRVEILA
jgi:uncharacterized protein (DUF1778 family)